jgi:hypothetical protein
MHYGSFSYGAERSLTAKRGFCLQSTLRATNNELSPLGNKYYDCRYQGVEVGWADEYKAGLECQWLDVTGIDTSSAPVTDDLTFTSNPDGFLCEGQPVLDSTGAPTFSPTPYTTAAGGPVDRPACSYSPNWYANNVDSYPVTVPGPGEGYVTQPCSRGQLGAARNCGLSKASTVRSCTPGSTVTLSCSIPSGSAPQALRVCEASAALGTGIPCLFDQSLSLATVDADGGSTLLDGGVITFTCPAARDATEPGGKYALYAGPLYPDDPSATVTCP